MSQTITFLHGFASSAKGTKAAYLNRRFAEVPKVDFQAFDFNPTPRDFEYMTVTGLINRLRQAAVDRRWEPLSLIGSSMGGLVGLNYAARFAGVSRLLLLAPALTYLSGGRTAAEDRTWREQGVVDVLHYGFGRPVPLRYDLEIDGRFYQEPPPPPCPVTIVHGRSDEVVPIAASRAYAAQYPEQIRLIEVEAGHDINAHLDLIWELIEAFLLD